MMRIVNIKVSFIFKKKLFEEKKVNQKINFQVNHKMCTIYPHTPTLINATKLKNYAEIKVLQKQLVDFYQVECDVRIDNVFLRCI